jgi:hypothetical protein
MRGEATSVVAAFHPVSHGRVSFVFPEWSCCAGRGIARLDRVGWEHASHTLGGQSFEQPAALVGERLPGEELPGARWRERSTSLGRADAGSAATHGPIHRPGEDLTAPVVSMEVVQGTGMEEAPAAPEPVLPAAMNPVE